MSDHNLLLYASLEASDPACGPAAYALGAAAALGAQLDVMVPNLDLPFTGHWEDPSAEELERESAARQRQVSALAEAIAEAARARGVPVFTQTAWAHAFGFLPFLTDRAKLYDLMITGVDRSNFLSEREIAEQALFESGRPVVVVPKQHALPFDCSHVTIAWDHSRSAARALHDALPFLRLAKEIRFVAVGGEKRFQTNPDRQIIELAMRQKALDVRFEQIELGGKSIGQALQDYALEGGADLLVMGAYGHSRLREFLLGGATREILDHPRLPVLLSH